uniref:RRM domain-containing protein n=1 Tax=Accipiter nisus TaxID=211598 RepID=A0A8B9NIZ1_9AVES
MGPPNPPGRSLTLQLSAAPPGAALPAPRSIRFRRAPLSLAPFPAAPARRVPKMAAAGGGGSGPVSGRTVLVRGLPAAATAAELESLFGRLGPLRRCFVVTEKGTKTCRGFGYVTFSLPEDAQRALQEATILGGRRLSVTLARQRPREGRKKPQREKEKEDEAAAGELGVLSPACALRDRQLPCICPQAVLSPNTRSLHCRCPQGRHHSSPETEEA